MIWKIRIREVIELPASSHHRSAYASITISLYGLVMHTMMIVGMDLSLRLRIYIHRPSSSCMFEIFITYTTT